MLQALNTTDRSATKIENCQNELHGNKLNKPLGLPQSLSLKDRSLAKNENNQNQVHDNRLNLNKPTVLPLSLSEKNRSTIECQNVQNEAQLLETNERSIQMNKNQVHDKMLNLNQHVQMNQSHDINYRCTTRNENIQKHAQEISPNLNKAAILSQSLPANNRSTAESQNGQNQALLPGANDRSIPMNKSGQIQTHADMFNSNEHVQMHQSLETNDGSTFMNKNQEHETRLNFSRPEVMHLNHSEQYPLQQCKEVVQRQWDRTREVDIAAATIASINNCSVTENVQAEEMGQVVEPPASGNKFVPHTFDPLACTSKPVEYGTIQNSNLPGMVNTLISHVPFPHNQPEHQSNIHITTGESTAHQGQSTVANEQLDFKEAHEKLCELEQLINEETDNVPQTKPKWLEGLEDITPTFTPTYSDTEKFSLEKYLYDCEPEDMMPSTSNTVHTASEHAGLNNVSEVFHNNVHVPSLENGGAAFIDERKGDTVHEKEKKHFSPNTTASTPKNPKVKNTTKKVRNEEKKKRGGIKTSIQADIDEVISKPFNFPKLRSDGPIFQCGKCKENVPKVPEVEFEIPCISHHKICMYCLIQMCIKSCTSKTMKVGTLICCKTLPNIFEDECWESKETFKKACSVIKDILVYLKPCSYRKVKGLKDYMKAKQQNIPYANPPNSPLYKYVRSLFKYAHIPFWYDSV